MRLIRGTPGGSDRYRGLGRVFAATAAVLLGAALAASPSLPASAGAPKVGSKAPDFRLPDAAGRMVSLSQLRASGPEGSWVLLVFYRGYW